MINPQMKSPHHAKTNWQPLLPHHAKHREASFGEKAAPMGCLFFRWEPRLKKSTIKSFQCSPQACQSHTCARTLARRLCSCSRCFCAPLFCWSAGLPQPPAFSRASFFLERRRAASPGPGLAGGGARERLATVPAERLPDDSLAEALRRRRAKRVGSRAGSNPIGVVAAWRRASWSSAWPQATGRARVTAASLVYSRDLRRPFGDRPLTLERCREYCLGPRARMTGASGEVC